MAEPFLSEIRVFSFGFAPKGWALCNGQTLSINQNQALFALLGTTYGGNGTTTFMLPNLQARVPIHQGTSPLGQTSVLGEIGGASTVALTIDEMATHTHSLNATNSTATASDPTGAMLAIPDVNPRLRNLYGTTPTGTLVAPSVAATGGNQPHANMQPTSVVNFCIALTGIFPSR